MHPCPRCKRLNIACVGLGQRRYKFVHDDKAFALDDNIVQQRVPRSETSADLTSAFNAVTINPARGIKFNLAWTYGDYLNDVPSRLGANEALDAATDTFVTAVEISFSKRGTNHTSILLEKYGKSLASLRKCLDDPVKVKTPETLCAILFLWNCQVFLLALTCSGMF